MGAEPPLLWTQVLGEAAAELWTLIREIDEEELACCPATLFADQSKAFERIGHLWLRRVFAGWHLPPWALEALLAM
eukprot:7243181-Alexandrium_andersonii.AAC.1